MSGMIDDEFAPSVLEENLPAPAAGHQYPPLRVTDTDRPQSAGTRDHELGHQGDLGADSEAI